MAADVVEVPERVGRYEILLPIAAGGMATVYLARAEGHGGFERYVALKLTLPRFRNDPQFASQLLDEAKLVAHLRHTNVVPVLDVGQDTLGVFLVMDYVPGDTLSGLMRAARAQGTKLPTRMALRVLVDALEGLHAAHEQADEDGYPLHLVHRDFSPQNILVGTDGVGRLTDFGIAKAASRASSTVAGLIKGKMSYVSPEHVSGLPLDRRCDLWAAGIVAWEIMCDRKLNAPGEQRALTATIDREPPRIRTIVPDAPEAIEAVIASVLKLDRDERLPTAALLARDLAAAARSAGLLAETHEVAAQVTRLAGPVLAERKARLADARRVRMASVPDGVATMVGLPSPFGSASKGAHGPVEDELSIVVTEGSEPPPPLFSAAGHDPTTTTGVGRSTGVPTEPEGEPGAAIPGLEARGPKVASIGGALGGVVLLVLVLVTLKIAAGRDASAVAGGTADASAAERASAGRSAVSGALGIAEVADGGEGEGIEAVAHVEFLALSSNAPISEVRIDDRVIDMVIPAPNVTVELELEETKRALVITIKSVDGRVATTELPRGELEAKLAFRERTPEPHVAAPPPATPRTTPAKPTAPSPPRPGKPGAPRRPW